MRAILLLLCGIAAAQDAVLNHDTFALWRDHVTPSEKETIADRMPWHATLGDGLRAAAKHKKPLLLWVMNGHPLGCT